MRLQLAVAAAAVAVMIGALVFADEPQGALSLEKRWELYKPYDGSGRYTMSKDDDVRGIEGLKALASRWGAKPYDALKLPDGTWRTERVIFRDVDTGALMMRLTNDPWADVISYFQGNWSADGKYIVWRRKPGMWEPSTPTHGPMVMNADGTNLRNVFRDYPMVRNERCSPTEPDVCYALAGDKKLIAFDLKTGKTRSVICDVPSVWHPKISQDGKYLMGRSDIKKGGKGFWIASTDGKEYYECPANEAVHDSYQFHPALKKIMFWYEGKYRTEGFVQCDFDGGNVNNVHVLFDWNHGDVGPDRGIHTGGYITRIKGDTWLPPEDLFHKPGVEYYDDPHDYNGYLSWWPKDELWPYATRIVNKPYVSEIQCFYAEPNPEFVVNRYRICYTGLLRGGALDDPNASPDGTKVLFNSNMLGRVDIFCVVARLPEPPVGLKAERAADGVKLTWQASKHHKETAGYYVYRSDKSGVDFTCITPKPVAATEFTDPAGAQGTFFYAAAAVENSGLEGGLSEEAAAGPADAAKRRVFIEAESGARTGEMWIAFEGTASDLHYVWMRKKDGTGKVTIPVTLPKMTGACTVWARVKGEKGAEFSVAAGGITASLKSPAAAAWTWVKSDAVQMLAGKQDLVLSSSVYGSAIDRLCITDDAGFSPAQSPRVKWAEPPAVADVRAEVMSPYAVKVTWKDVRSDAFHHYNVYEGAVPTQSALVASVDRSEFIDWGLKPDSGLVYCVTAVDRAGNESKSSLAPLVRTPKVETVVVEKDGAPSVEFEAPADGTYAVWLRMKKGERPANYCTVKVDNAGGGTWTCSWDGLGDDSWFSYDGWGRFDLKAGKHTLTIDNKTGNVIEKVLVTNNLWTRPSGHVNILGGW